VLRQLYQYYGDRALVEEQYATAKRWLDLVTAANPGFIVSKGLHDHETLAPAPTPVMVTPLYADSVRLVGELAEILGRDKEAQQYRKLLADIRETYAKKFVDPATGRVGPGTQGSQAFGLRLDMVPADQRRAALDVLLDDIQGKQSGHLATGIFGTKFMLTELSREGQAGVAYTIASQTNFPGWGYMLANDATTLWEHWKGSDNTFSHNHPMFGSVSEWFYQWLGGIQPAPDAVAFDRIVIRPQPVGDLTWVRCHYDSIRGPIATRWDRKGTRLTLAIEIPPNTTATVHVPCEAADAVTEGGKPAARAAGVRVLEARSGEAVFEVGSGRYRFETTLPDRR
jgi:alpha-L-rhamnosidase